MRPFFSVIVSTYNRLLYLLEELESVRRQSFTDYEVIVSMKAKKGIWRRIEAPDCFM